MSSFDGQSGGTGRSNARGERTRIVIVDALLKLVGEGDVRPTVPRVAERADLSLRTVFHHFNEVEALLEAALERQLKRSGVGTQRLPVGLSESARLDRFVRQRCRFFEATAPIRRAVRASPQATRLIDRLAQLCREERDETIAVLGAGIPALPPPERAVAEAALASAACFSTWETLRLRFELNADATRRAMHRSLASQLSLAVDA